MVKQKTLTLRDSDGDGVIKFEWDDKHDGITVFLYDDLFNREASGDFYKRDLIKKLKKLIEKLDK